ncbi:MAG: carboxypeptidase-like regulatory domain-containing protein [Dehalococcoidia bacterium]
MNRVLRIVFGFALVAVLVLFARGNAPNALASTAAMQFRVAGGFCDSPTTPTTCDVGAGNSFSLFVDLAKAPIGGYVSFQTEIDYDGLTYHPGANAGAEILWPDSAFPLRSPASPTGTEGLINHASATTPPTFPVSSYAGVLLELDLECTGTISTQTIELVPFEASNTNASGLKPSPSAAVIALSDSLTIECTTGVPIFTPITLIAGQHVRWECQPGEPHYHSLFFHYTWGDEERGFVPPPLSYTQEPSPALQGMECWHNGTNTLVWYYLVSWLNLTDIRGTVVDAGSGIPMPFANLTLQRNVSGTWTNVSSGELTPSANPRGSTIDGAFGWNIGSASGSYRVTASAFGCATNNTGSFTLPATDILIGLICDDSDGDGLPDFADNITIYDNFTYEYITQPDNPDTDGDTVPDDDDDCDEDGFSNLVELRDYRSDPCEDESYDIDSDGCTSMEELRASEELGGRRDSQNPWDFFDTNGDKVIDLFIDIFGVAGAFGLAPSDPGYSTALDRSAPSTVGDPWDLGAPDGTIDLFTDVFGVANQFGHSCEAAP